MSDPDWIGREPLRPYWADDSASVYYWQKRPGEEEEALFRIDLASGETSAVPDRRLGEVDAPGGDCDSECGRRVFERNGDLFLKDLLTGETHQLTRTAAKESSPAFLLDEELVVFQRDDVILVRDLATGLESQPADLRFAEDPEEAKGSEEEDASYLERQQERLIATLRERAEREERAKLRAREKRSVDASRTPLPWYLGKDRELAGAHLSPDGRWMLVRSRAKDAGGAKRDVMPDYVTESSWVDTSEVRPHVGETARRAQTLHLLDLETHERFDLDLSPLPGIAEDPLAWLAEEEGESPEAEDGAGPRGISLWTARWAPDASALAFQAHSLDNKDRWLARVDLATKEVHPIHHLRDEAWICRTFNEYLWLDDSSGIWFLSEETGHSQLYLWDAAADETRTLTEGDFEISRVETSPDGGTLYFLANATHPGIHEVHRLRLPDGEPERLTDLGGKLRYVLSHDGEQLLLTHSKALHPPELYLQDAEPGAAPRRLTHTVTDEFLSFAWTAPEVVAIPSRGGGDLYARVYTPAEPPAPGELRPAVAFVHGAGYLQNAHLGWSTYFREFLFHSLLVQEGFVVLDVDYRGSAGYGRDWRTAIYRQMGTPELEDYEDAVAWLVANRSVDPARVGVYGGSYGGFLTLMALFRHPDLFACGAALRPVTDWAHYNDPYTSNILNTPELDPEAFEQSSPIEFAEGLEKPLLICHGMLDSNVLAKDSIRLAQRLIELKKKDWELALYPLEGHAFREPESWLDEYRRIFELMTETLGE